VVSSSVRSSVVRVVRVVLLVVFRRVASSSPVPAVLRVLRAAPRSSSVRLVLVAHRRVELLVSLVRLALP